MNNQGRPYSQGYKHIQTQVSVTAEHTFLISIAENRKYSVTRFMKAQALSFKSKKHEDMFKECSGGAELFLHFLFKFPK